jgi:dUTP pyrophosphatase
MKIEIIDFGAAEKGRLPKRAKPMDAGADVFAPKNWNLDSGRTVKLPLGFGVKIPNGFAGYVYPRGRMSEKGITCQLCPIDASYTGEINAIVTNESPDSFYITEGDRIGQLVIMPCVLAEFVTEPLEARGDNGFGSTGK